MYLRFFADVCIFEPISFLNGQILTRGAQTDSSAHNIGIVCS